MSRSESRVIDRNGTQVVVDATGEELVCRRRSRYAHGCYHRIDPERLQQAGVIRPACRVTGADDANWRPVTRSTISATWDGCTYPACYGPGDPQHSTGPHLKTALAEMSVAEFDAAVAAHSDGGEH